MIAGGGTRGMLGAGANAAEAEQGQWRLFGFDFAGDRYGFEIASDAGRARVVVNAKAALELPMPIWHAILDAVNLQRRLERRLAAAAVAKRLGAQWTEAEDAQLKEGKARGLSVSDMAFAHQRTAGAIAARLEALGLVDGLIAAQETGGDPLRH